MERTDICPPTNYLYLKNLDNLSKSTIIISDKESSPYYHITSTSSIIPDTRCIGHHVTTYYVISSAPIHDMQQASPGTAVTLPGDNKIISSHIASLNISGLS